MAAGKATYIIVWEKSSQVYSAASLETAIKTPIPKGCTIDDKRILLASFLPDEKQLCVYKLEQEQIDKKLEEIQQKEQEKLEAKAARVAADEAAGLESVSEWPEPEDLGTDNEEQE